MAILIHVSVALRQGEAVLLVQERKPENHGLWSLPGGHLEMGETPEQGAIREIAEETELTVTLTGLSGIYSTIRKPDYQAIRFVFTGQFTGEPVAGDDILAVRWFTPSEIATLSDTELVGRERLRAILADVFQGERYPLSLLTAFTC